MCLLIFAIFLRHPRLITSVTDRMITNSPLLCLYDYLASDYAARDVTPQRCTCKKPLKLYHATSLQIEIIILIEQSDRIIDNIQDCE